MNADIIDLSQLAAVLTQSSIFFVSVQSVGLVSFALTRRTQQMRFVSKNERKGAGDATAPSPNRQGRRCIAFADSIAPRASYQDQFARGTSMSYHGTCSTQECTTRLPLRAVRVLYYSVHLRF